MTPEQTNVLDYLDHYREELEKACSGLTPEQLARRAVPPSTLSLLGLLRHLAKVEHYWTRMCMERDPGPRLYGVETTPDADFDGAVADQSVVDEAWEVWRREVEHARAYEAAHDMDTMGDHRGEPTQYRDVLVHMVEEYARHLGHADLIREVIDGRNASEG